MNTPQHANDGMTLAELSNATGVSRRTIRYYAQRGLLPPVAGRGRTARYGPEHAEALARIHAMQRAGARLKEVRRALSGELHHAVVEIDGGQRYAISIVPGIELHVDRRRWSYAASDDGFRELTRAFEDALRAIAESKQAANARDGKRDGTEARDE